jgi:hypothetical protein
MLTGHPARVTAAVATREHATLSDLRTSVGELHLPASTRWQAHSCPGDGQGPQYAIIDIHNHRHHMADSGQSTRKAGPGWHVHETQWHWECDTAAE